VLLVDDFQDLDRGQFELIRALTAPDGAVAVEVFGDPTGARFAFRGTSDRFLLRDFPAAYRPVELALGIAHATNDALRAAVDRLVANTDAGGSSNGGVNRGSGPTGDLPLFASAAHRDVAARRPWGVDVDARVVRDEIAEAQHAALLAGRWIREHGAHALDIAVVATDPARYRTRLLMAFRDQGVPIDVGGSDSTAVDDLIRSLLGVLGKDADGRFVASLASSPLYTTLCNSLGCRTGEIEEAVKLVRRVAGARGSDVESVLRLVPRAREAAASAVANAIEEWSRYQEVVALAGGAPSFDEFRSAYLEETPSRAPRASAVRMLSPREATGRSFASVIVVGCAEGLLSGDSAREGYLPVGALAAVLEGVNADVSRELARRIDRVESERLANALLLTAITRARDRLVVLAPRKAGGEAVSPAREIAPLLRSDEPLDRVAAPALRAARVVAAMERSERAAAAARPFDSAICGRLSPPRAARLPVIPSFSLSASGMETFSNCPRRFFYEKLLRVDDSSSIYMTVGLLFHDVMKRLVQPGMARDEVIAALSSEHATVVIDEEVDAAMPEAGTWLRELTRVYATDMLARAAQLERDRIGDYRVESVETPGELRDGDLHFRGRLDRIDRVDGLGPVVIDYKTSGGMNKSFGILVRRIDAAGERSQWQVPLYSAMASAAGTEPSAFVYYVVPPGEDAFATGLQLAAGKLPDPIPRGRRPHERYGEIPPASIRGALAEAFAVHADVASGAHAFPRTEDREACRRCAFVFVCRRSNE